MLGLPADCGLSFPRKPWGRERILMYHNTYDPNLSRTKARMSAESCEHFRADKRSLASSQEGWHPFCEAKAAVGVLAASTLFSAGPGFSVDCERARLLRWEVAELIVEHG